jgi:hypothetical protein
VVINTLELIDEEIPAHNGARHTVIPAEGQIAHFVTDDAGIECVHGFVFGLLERDAGQFFSRFLIKDDLLDGVTIVNDALDAEVEFTFDFTVFGAAPVLENPRTVLGWTAFDEARPGLHIDECASSVSGVVTNLEVEINLFDCGSAVEFDRVLAFVLVGDDVGEVVDAVLVELWEVRLGPGSEFDRPGLIAEESDLSDSVTAWFPEVNDLGGDINPLFGFVDSREVDFLIAVLEVVTGRIGVIEVGVDDAPTSFFEWDLILVDEFVEALLDILWCRVGICG